MAFVRSRVSDNFSEETRQRFTDVAEAMLSVNAGAARAATGAL